MSKSKSPTDWLRAAIKEDFHKLYVRQFRIDWEIQRLVQDTEIDVMALTATEQAILNQVEELVGRIIGEDEMSHRVGFGGAVMGLTHKDINRNKLRAEQRSQAKQLLKGKD
jgi:hypothetical protein